MSTLRELEAAATPAPWAAEWPDRPWFVLGEPPAMYQVRSPQDAALIAAARNALPLLLDVVDAARALLASADGYEQEARERGVWENGAAVDETIVLGIQRRFRAALAALDAEPLP